jgi:hypothetical protein
MAKTRNSLAQLIDSVMTRLNFKPFNLEWSHFWNRSNELSHFKLKLCDVECRWENLLFPIWRRIVSVSIGRGEGRQHDYSPLISKICWLGTKKKQQGGVHKEV